MTIIFKLYHDEIFKKKYAPGKLLVLFADTGDENHATYEYRDTTLIPFCKKHNIEFYSITNDMGYHGKTWLTLQHQWRNGTPTVGSLGFVKSCSHQLKLLPQYRFRDKGDRLL